MPPDGYETVTLPASIVDRLDAITDDQPHNGRVDTIRMLIDEYQSSEDNIDYAEIERRCQRAVSNELEMVR